MPNQSDPNQPAINPPAVAPPMDLPPLPQEFPGAQQNIQSPLPPTPSVDQGSAAPPETPPVISSTPKKKFGGGRIIATILGVLVLVGGLGAGYVLTQQPQLLQPQARVCVDVNCAITGNTSGSKITYTYDKAKRGEDTQQVLDQIPELKTAVDNGQNSVTIDTNSTEALKVGCMSGNTADCISLCGQQPSEIQNTCVPPGVGCTTAGGTACTEWHWTNCIGGGINGVGCGTGTTSNQNNNESPPSSPPSAPSCLNVTAYGTAGGVTTGELKSLSATDLTNLKPGDSVTFCVNGSVTPPSSSKTPFDKADFKINGNILPETTATLPYVPGAICQDYTIAPTDTTVSVKAKIHDATSSTWVGESF